MKYQQVLDEIRAEFPGAHLVSVNVCVGIGALKIDDDMEQFSGLHKCKTLDDAIQALKERIALEAV